MCASLSSSEIIETVSSDSFAFSLFRGKLRFGISYADDEETEVEAEGCILLIFLTSMSDPSDTPFPLKALNSFLGSSFLLDSSVAV